MKILVAYKRVVDYNVRIQVKPDGSGVVTDGVKLSANPFDEIALEEALRLRDKGIATEVVVATIAPADAQAHLRNGLRSEEHTSELQSLMRNSYAGFCLKKKKNQQYIRR